LAIAKLLSCARRCFSAEPDTHRRGAGMTNGVDRVAAQAAGMDPDRLDALVDFLDRTYLASSR